MLNTKTTKIKMSTGEKIFSVINYIFLALVAAACLYPMLYVLFASFSNSNQLMRHTGILLWPQGFSAGAYEMVFKNPMIARGYLNTMFVLVMSLILQITLTSLGAYFLSRRNVMFQKPIMLLITFTMFFSGGMIPKVECCTNAIRAGVRKVFIIDGRVPHALLIETLTDEGAGTMFKKEIEGNYVPKS